MIRNGISILGKHSFKDFGMKLIDRKIEYPNKNKILSTVPFMNGFYDFSKLYGTNTYGDRKLSYTFRLHGINIADLNLKQTQISNWLNSSEYKLYDDFYPGYYFIAECDYIDFKEININKRYGDLKINFIAQPFKIREYDEGDIPWDDFYFELDCLQETKFDINGSKKVNIYNRSATNITPTIVCSSNMEIVKDGIIYKLNPGTSKDYRLEFNMGNNKMTIKGNGTIEFKFKAEVL